MYWVYEQKEFLSRDHSHHQIPNLTGSTTSTAPAMQKTKKMCDKQVLYNKVMYIVDRQGLER